MLMYKALAKFWYFNQDRISTPSKKPASALVTVGKVNQISKPSKTTKQWLQKRQPSIETIVPYLCQYCQSAFLSAKDRNTHKKKCRKKTDK
jgi:hypothetical protein